MSIQSIPTLPNAVPTHVPRDPAPDTSSDFRDAFLAALALMAHADGEMAGVERRRILALARDNALLAETSRDKIVEELAVHEANFRLDPEVAQLLAREKLVRVAGHRRAAQMIVSACRTILPADGVAHPSEYRILAEIRSILGLERHLVSAPLPTGSAS